jgi:hypothetical protein
LILVLFFKAKSKLPSSWASSPIKENIRKKQTKNLFINEKGS